MRKLILPTILALVAAPATAQTTLGLRGGIGLATVAVDADDFDADYSSGIVAGMDLTIPVSGFLGFRFGGAYAEKGGKATVEDPAGNTEVELHMNQAQFSLLARIGTPSAGGLSVGLMAGPWAAYQLSCEAEASVMAVNLTLDCEDADWDFETIDYGVAFGGGVEFPVIGSLRLGAEAIYSLGLAQLDADETRTRHLAAQGGIVIPIG